MVYEDKVRTHLVRARILTGDYEIEGNVHIKQGMDSGKVSDILSAPDSAFIPVTQAKCTNRASASSRPVHTDCTIVQVKTIKMVFPFED